MTPRNQQAWQVWTWSLGHGFGERYTMARARINEVLLLKYMAEVSACKSWVLFRKWTNYDIVISIVTSHIIIVSQFRLREVKRRRVGSAGYFIE